LRQTANQLNEPPRFSAIRASPILPVKMLLSGLRIGTCSECQHSVRQAALQQGRPLTQARGSHSVLRVV